MFHYTHTEWVQDATGCSPLPALIALHLQLHCHLLLQLLSLHCPSLYFTALPAACPGYFSVAQNASSPPLTDAPDCPQNTISWPPAQLFHPR